MKTNGFAIWKMGQTKPLSRPLLDQVKALTKHRDKYARKRERLFNLLNADRDNAELVLQLNKVESIIMKNNFDLINLQSQLGSLTNPRPRFNRQEVVREKHIVPDRGRILYSRDGEYGVESHRGVKEKQRPKNSIITAV